jgi:hypothetical protein
MCFHFSSQVFAVTSVVLHHNHVSMEPDVRLPVWKTDGDFNVVALKANPEIDVRMCPEIAHFMQIIQTKVVACALSSRLTILLTTLFVIRGEL